MLIKDNKTHLTEIDKLDEYEARIFIYFLESERSRHIDDAMDIERKIAQLKDKYLELK